MGTLIGNFVHYERKIIILHYTPIGRLTLAYSESCGGSWDRLLLNTLLSSKSPGQREIVYTFPFILCPILTHYLGSSNTFLVIFLKLTAAKRIIQQIENKNKIRGAYVELGERGTQKAHWANCTNCFSHYVRYLDYSKV